MQGEIRDIATAAPCMLSDEAQYMTRSTSTYVRSAPIGGLYSAWLNGRL
jgi:hypothetical protein